MQAGGTHGHSPKLGHSDLAVLKRLSSHLASPSRWIWTNCAPLLAHRPWQVSSLPRHDCPGKTSPHYAAVLASVFSSSFLS
ncbi:MAG: hypothetical protein ACPIOQ_69845, partial [Promethearchaeia archaeon]